MRNISRSGEPPERVLLFSSIDGNELPAAGFRKCRDQTNFFSVTEIYPALVWFRNDLRLHDNPALWAALKSGHPIVPVFVWAPEEEEPWPPGAASRWWLERSLVAFEQSLREAGSRLILARGQSGGILLELARETGARKVFWNKRFEPTLRRRDESVAKALRATGLEVFSFNGSLLHDPEEVRNKAGKPFQVFTPFWKHCLSLGEPTTPRPAPTSLVAPARWPRSLVTADLKLGPVPDWAGGLAKAWEPGEAGALRQLKHFCAENFSLYSKGRNELAKAQTSRLSPHLHFGEISPRKIWHAAQTAALLNEMSSGQFSQSTFLAELGWREFAHHLLHHFPQSDREALRENFANFEWRKDPKALRSWQRGRTGFPVVDAGMRELWVTGWMHNRARMIVASFLVKDLLIPWQSGAEWFWDTLVDADLAQNTLGWQWSAGTGADAAPFFRIFNPTTQGEKFDREGEYVRRWVPELARMPASWIHKPQQAPEEVLQRAGVSLGKNYPYPIVNHSIARMRALERYGTRLN